MEALAKRNRSLDDVSMWAEATCGIVLLVMGHDSW